MPEPQPTFFKKWLPLFVMGLAIIIIVLDTTLLNVSLGTIVRDLHTNIQRVPHLKRLPLNPACQRFAVDILHYDEAVTTFFADFKHCADIRMIERSCCFCFPDEAFLTLFTHNGILRKELDGDLPVERSILGEIDLTHPARTQFAQDAVVIDGPSFH